MSEDLLVSRNASYSPARSGAGEFTVGKGDARDDKVPREHEKRTRQRCRLGAQPSRVGRGERRVFQELHSRQLAAHPLAWGIWSNSRERTASRRRRQRKGRSRVRLRRRSVVDRSGKTRSPRHGARQLCGSASALRLARCEDLPERGMPRSRRRGARSFSDASFDVVFCDHGAMSCADPKTTIPEVARILRPGGFLAFSTEHPLHAACWDDAANAVSRQLQRGYFALRRIEDPVDASVNFIRPVGTWVALLLAGGFALEALLEPRPKANATTTYTGYASRAWARAFPAELMIGAEAAVAVLRLRLSRAKRLSEAKMRSRGARIEHGQFTKGSRPRGGLGRSRRRCMRSRRRRIRDRDAVEGFSPEFGRALSGRPVRVVERVATRIA